MQMKPITEEYLLSKGFKIDKGVTYDMLSHLNAPEGYIYMTSKDNRVIIEKYYTNRESPYDWYVHVDNEAYETIGSLDCAYIEEFETFLKLCGIN